MCDAVAVTAFRELGEHRCRVRSTVAALALRNHLVLGLVTCHAAKVLVLESTCGEKVVCRLVACRTILGRCRVGIRNVLRHMCLVTFLAVSLLHLLGVRLVALNAFRNFTMGVMAEGTGQHSVLALVVSQLDDLLGVAGKAGISNVAPHLDIERGMRVTVAGVAPGKLVVWFPLVTLAAYWNNLFNCRRMAGMAILTADGGLVLASV